GPAAGVALDYGKSHDCLSLVLALLTLVAYLAGAGTIVLMRRQAEVAPPPKTPWSHAHMVAPFFSVACRRFMIYQVFWSAAVGASTAFYPLFAIERLHLGFSGYAIYAAVVTMTRSLALPRFARAIETFGARSVLALCTFGLVVSPLLWLLALPAQ